MISVTPVARGLAKPVLSFVTAIALVQCGARRFHFVHVHESVLLLIVAGPCLLVVLTRLWRWRSHKVHVTSQRIIVEGGVLGHFRTAVELHDVIAVRVEQRLAERLARRGRLLFETSAGTMEVGIIRHPAALARVIDGERMNLRSASVPFDTVFSFEQPEPYRPRVPHERLEPRPFEGPARPSQYRV